MVGIILQLSCLAPTAGSKAAELGVNSNHVYDMWQNINFATEELFLELYGIPLDHASAVKPRQFMGKSFDDVMQKAEKLNRELELVIDIKSIKPEPAWVQEYKDLSHNSSTSQKHHTSGDIYIMSSRILHSIVDRYVEITDGEKSIRHFYPKDAALPQEKTVDDVYAELDLLSTKLEYILSNPINLAGAD